MIYCLYDIRDIIKLLNALKLSASTQHTFLYKIIIVPKIFWFSVKTISLRLSTTTGSIIEMVLNKNQFILLKRILFLISRKNTCSTSLFLGNCTFSWSEYYYFYFFICSLKWVRMISPLEWSNAGLLLYLKYFQIVKKLSWYHMISLISESRTIFKLWTKWTTIGW